MDRRLSPTEMYWSLCTKHLFFKKSDVVKQICFRHFYNARMPLLQQQHQYNTPEDNGVSSLSQRLFAGDRGALAKSITLAESVHPHKKLQAKKLLSEVMRKTKPLSQLELDESPTFRIGLSGAPGGGKSTLIDTFGKLLTSQGHRVAVLAVDPSSMQSGGSILGDKTRMTNLCVDPDAYIRASPSSGTLGGVTRTTSEAVLLCEAAGYDIILIETVGVGQSEVAVAQMVDMFLLLVNPGSGDELQGVKRGIMELADVVTVTKSDGELLTPARRTHAEYTSALKILKPRSKMWKPKVVRVSAIKNEGIDDLWSVCESYRELMWKNGELIEKRRRQNVKWMWRHIDNNLMSLFQQHSAVAAVVSDIERRVFDGEMEPGAAADMLMDKFRSADG